MINAYECPPWAPMVLMLALCRFWIRGVKSENVLQNLSFKLTKFFNKSLTCLRKYLPWIQVHPLALVSVERGCCFWEINIDDQVSSMANSELYFYVLISSDLILYWDVIQIFSIMSGWTYIWSKVLSDLKISLATFINN